MKKLVYGKGHNDGSRPAKIAGKHLKEYSLWKGMLERCFCDKSKIKRPTYVGCTVSDNFLNYSYFYDWCQTQIGFGKQGWQLDKDILITDNKIYGECTCAFVPRDINIFFIDRAKSRGDCSLGVHFNKRDGMYQSNCRVSGVLKHLGYYDTEQEAFLAYKPFKENLCKDLALKCQSEIDPRVFQAMMNWQVQNN